MRFALAAESRQFAQALDDLLGDAGVPAVIRAWNDGKHQQGLDLWSQLADLGVTGLLVPEGLGGAEAEPVDLVVAFERLGYHGVPGPLVESVAAVPVLLAGLEAAERYLPEVASGAVLATVAAPPHVPYALDADVADLVLYVQDGVLRRVSDAPAEPVSSVDKSRRLFPVAGGEVLAEAVEGGSARAFDFAVLASAAQLLGAGRWLLDAAVEYAKQRRQFGREIGQFQAIKHLLAEVVTRIELARPLLHGASVTLAQPRDEAPRWSRDISAARVAAADAAHLAARACLQVHGAVGYTAEHDVGLWLTKVRALLTSWGTQAYHRGRVAEALEGRR